MLRFLNYVINIVHILLIGIGVDDMFILLSGLTDAPLRGTVEERISFTMRTTGVAITITSLTDLIAFMVGYMSDFMSVRHFCLYTGAYIRQSTNSKMSRENKLFHWHSYHVFFYLIMIIAINRNEMSEM